VIAEVAVPIVGIDEALSYAVPVSMEPRIAAGMRVVVNVGSKRVVGLVMDVHDDTKRIAQLIEKMGGAKLRPVFDTVDEAPIVDDAQLALVKFVASYYMAELGACARLVLPPDTASVVERRYQLTEQGERARVFADALGLTKKSDRALLELFAPGERKPERKIARTKAARDKVADLVVRGFIEEIRAESAAGKVRHTEHLVVVDGGAEVPKRATSLAAFDAWLRAFNKREGRAATMHEAEVATGSGARGKAKKLAALGRVRIDETVPVTTSSAASLKQRGLAESLTEHQQHAVARIERAIDARATTAFLIEGVTGSGKTEVYLRALRACLDRGRSAILLVPEIGLTPQLVGRVEAALADRPGDVVVLHSGITAPARRDALARLREGSARVAVGARSALFAPVRDLGLIVVDEEHDGSLKQDEQPRYHARDVALWRARNEGAVCVLGSATPSLETRHNVDLKKIELIELPTRAPRPGGAAGAMPDVEVIDLRARDGMKEARKRDRLNADEGPGVVLSAPLVEAMGTTLADGGQVVLFLNKRGYASAVLCEACGHIETCPNCSVSLTLHRRRAGARATGSRGVPGLVPGERPPGTSPGAPHAAAGHSAAGLVCHQCDFESQVPTTCIDCGNDALLALGLGTERLESEVKARFPDARVARLDRDALQKKGALEQTLAKIHAREVDIVVGTQMVAKGHDFPGVRLVGVVLADIALAMPDFRASERAFALIAQVAGRAGRGEEAGRVLVQTYSPGAPAIAFALTHDVKGFAAQELAERKMHNYPPFTRAALLRIEGEEASVVPTLAADVASAALNGAISAGIVKRGASGGSTIVGPAPCALEKLQGRTRWQVFVRTETVQQRTRVLDAVRAATRAGQPLARDLQRARARLILDLDPIRVL
jgi:primosomal protein N' (replication factor Y)